ncbi:MAG: Mth938-like domain-containing protein [archaeon GB-1867-035]|nr:Mth938-like domain-containing protein [Candidatus Culexmicrobium profundum]
MIEKYTFGLMIIDGVKYTRDLIILPTGEVKDDWWRIEGHRLHLDDLNVILNLDVLPEVLVIGTGYSGLMKVPKHVVEELRERGIEVIIEQTGVAWKTFNKLLHEGRRVAAAFHLTC